MSNSPAAMPIAPDESTATQPDLAWPALPTETEIYILPTGEVVVADLPAELADLVARLGLGTVDGGKTDRERSADE